MPADSTVIVRNTFSGLDVGFGIIYLTCCNVRPRWRRGSSPKAATLTRIAWIPLLIIPLQRGGRQAINKINIVFCSMFKMIQNDILLDLMDNDDSLQKLPLRLMPQGG